ncbi:MAG TPA: IPT/TIG domain-containing protein [Burkholderiales bacterium]|nr:IPT/TIG domain-containing protein [Burkholderiales bacterium]
MKIVAGSLPNRRRVSAMFGLIVAASLVLSACGGGGGGGSDSPGSGGSLAITPTALNFSAEQNGALPSPQGITATYSESNVAKFVVGYPVGTIPPTWLDLSISGASSPLTVNAVPTTTALPPGTYTATVSIATATANDTIISLRNATVTYTVSTLLVSPVAIDFVTTTGIQPASTTLNLDTNSAGTAWSGTIAYTSASGGWLSLTAPTSAVLPASVTVNADVTSIPAGVHTATITIHAGSTTTVVPVSLTVSDPRVNFVSPYVGTASIPGGVIIRGFGFSSVQTGIEVLFGSTAASSVSYVSDTEVRATYPALAAGDYPISIKNSSTTLPSRATAKLVIVDPPGYAYAPLVRNSTFVTPSGVSNLIYDAERKAVYLLDGDRKRIDRFRFINGTGWTVDMPVSLSGLGIPANTTMALSPDGTEILSTFGKSMLRIDPSNLALLETVDATSFLGGSVFASLNQLDFANDGNAIGTSVDNTASGGLYRYDMLTKQFAVLSSQTDMANRLVVASGDRGTIFLPTFESLIQALAKPVFKLTASSLTLTQTTTLTTGSFLASADRTGSKVILLNAGGGPTQAAMVFDSSLNPLGTLPDNPPDLHGFVISPDGTKAYAYYTGANVIRKFDLTTMGGITEIGTGTPIADSPGSFYSAMTISPDGGTLFLASNERLIVMPAP